MLRLPLVGVINAPLAPLVNCQRDLMEDGKAVREVFRAEIPPVYRGCCWARGGGPSQPGLGARKSLFKSARPSSSPNEWLSPIQSFSAASLEKKNLFFFLTE